MKNLLVKASVLAMALMLTACSSTTSDVVTEEAVSTTEEATTEEVVEEEASTTSDKVWIVATDTTFLPFEYTNESGEFVGIDVDILAAVAADQGFAYELQSLGWDGAVAAVQAGQADAIIAGASITDERKASGWMFSDGYFTATQTIAVAAGTEVTSWEDLAGKSVAAKNGTMGAAYAAEMSEVYGFTVAVFDDSPTMYQDVLAGNSFACFDDAPVMAATIVQNGLALEIPEGFDNEGADYGFAVMSEEAQELLDMFNAGLTNIKANGIYDQIIAQYLG
ncbi:MAG: transporter substrate-binding domain-containing protein [Eubacteriales bacterium]